MKNNLKSIILVFLQFACITITVFSGHPAYSGTLFIILFTSGLITGLWAVISMSRSRLTVMPDLKPGSIFIDTGPYKAIRHPMYLSVILVCMAFVLGSLTLLKIITLAVLVAVLLIKIGHEEKQLKKGFPEYTPYAGRTRKIIPFIY